MRKSIFLGVCLLAISSINLACSTQPSPAAESLQKTQNQTSATLAPTMYPALDQDTISSGQHPYSYLTNAGEEIQYLLYIPDNLEAHQEWPLIVFFHGYAPGAGINTPIRTKGLPYFIEDDPDFGFIVLSPILPSGRWGKYIHPVDELLLNLIDTLPIDANRLYLTGLSLGGIGVWQYALEVTDRFAAIAPMAGFDAQGTTDPVPDNICTLKNLPIWVFHGEMDEVFSADLAKAYVDELTACGAQVEFTSYPDANHSETWERAYADPELYAWFLTQSN